MIDLHTHTTASDGRCTPQALVARASAAGVRVLAVTDHDTVAGCAATAAACHAAGIDWVPGIEITAVLDGRDVHVLGYFIDVETEALQAFLLGQRRQRLDRVRLMVDRLAAHGVTLDAAAILQPALDDPARAAGRPWIARALVAGGHTLDSNDAFERWLAPGRPAFVPRNGAPPEVAIVRIHEAGGLASLAHPALGYRDDWISSLAAAGLDALEAYHPDHDEAATRHYLALADRLGLAVSGGSDFHADETHGGLGPGSISLPRPAYEHLVRRRANA